jgi:nicotinate-nucleotide pyrophosphorylase (carboxylating)
MLYVPQSEIEDNAMVALREDIGSGDITAELIPEDEIVLASVITREACVFCGMDWFEEVFRQVNDEVFIEWNIEDGEHIEANATLCSISGSARSILTAERTALNFIQLLSATATLSSRYAQAVEGTGAIVLDTRKTIPGLRLAQKYAVSCGGCQNHRIGLYDAILIKENHIVAHGSIAGAVEEAKFLYPDTMVEVEAENIDEFSQALNAGARRVLLDNFSLDDLREAVSINNKKPDNEKIELEASGGVTLENIHSIAQTGVDYISTGALTKDVQAIDLSMRIM